MLKKILFASTILSLGIGSQAFAASTEERLKALEQEIQILRRQAEVEKEVADAAAARTANIEYNKSGLKVSSKDGSRSLKIRGYVQVDQRSFFNDSNKSDVDTFTVRRARPIIEAQVDEFSVFLSPDFGGGNTRLYDAYVEFKPSKYFNLRAGKFKAPVGLEHLKSSTDNTFVETGLPSNLVSNRDVGLMAYGNIIPELEYQFGVFNGVANASMDDTEIEDSKEIAGRLFVQPFKTSANALTGLGFGVAGTFGNRDGSTTSRQLGSARTAGQATFFQYRSTAFAKGDQWRISPQAYYYFGPFGALAEYVVASEDVTLGTRSQTLKNDAWQAQLTYVLTGEDATYKWVSPSSPFSWSKKQWGAWEVGAVIGELTIDDDTFSVFADPTVSARKARNYGLVLNGYLNDNVKLTFDYEHTTFDGGAANNRDRESEQVLLSRVTYKF
ncbi:MAG: oprP [Rickettsiaceae bacterium]|jgi:phosphate-selective porin OprO/OprP|nr:oprP [Rickettsiaceae bacterium]